MSRLVEREGDVKSKLANFNVLGYLNGFIVQYVTLTTEEYKATQKLFNIKQNA